VFLILLGLPVNLEGITMPSILLVMVIFSVRLARRMHGCSLGYLFKNALVMGVVAAFLAYLLMSMINHWQAVGIDEKQYFYNVSGKTMTVLSGVPEAELDPNPERDPLTGEYPEGATLRTNPMRLTFDSDTGLEALGVNLIIGGFYGFMLLLIVAALLGAGLTWAATAMQIGSYRKQLTKSAVDNPLSRRVALMLPLIFFALLWLTEGHGSNDPILSFGSSDREIQLLLGFGIILWGLVALRSAQPGDWGLAYPVRLAVCLGLIAVLIALAIWRVSANDTVLPPSRTTRIKQNTQYPDPYYFGCGRCRAGMRGRCASRGASKCSSPGHNRCWRCCSYQLYFDQYQNQ
jgi:hypothetical protein